MPELTEITLWERLDQKADRWIYNHFSEGFVEDQNEPIAKGKVQESSWTKGQWRKKRGALEGLQVTES
jgi:hypothetical protein